ncbi:MAG: Prolyl-tRNA synthetase (EC, bacterial type [uncultured Sulfurovum sp.]|uniref:Proline--tRNA ligase n=1 Tax=uncultured Sulfurovum sp. TaxID=269237 RepID=A0A6S6TMR1_9BACT|nr:MAG: Prolyl-tRNA synthetase (EC, bacterial type [uncultured Sulfurovum sp.]
MKFSRMLIPTTKETPNDAVLASHKLLLRAGFIQSSGGSGLYNFLPLGKITLEKVKKVVKEELDKAGCNEVHLPMVTSQALWDETGRTDKMGKELLRFKDRHENDFVLSPTNEEAMVNLVRQTVKSYKQLPINVYQINWKFRDEVRPRFGLMRGREFLMKDAYSFHTTTEDMEREFALMEETYKKIFTRLGLEFKVVEADSGAIGGAGSKEFMVLADSGEDTIMVCDACDFGANVEVIDENTKNCACGGELKQTKGIEAGHIFQLGTTYSEAMKAEFLNENQKLEPFVMGTYGIGVSRLLAGIIEQNHDEHGCVWTKESAPFNVDIIVAKAKKEEQMSAGIELYEALQAKGVDVLLDDRADKKTGFGVKVKDFELIGMNYALVVGNDIEEGNVELISRKNLSKELVALDEVVNVIMEKLA